MLNEIFGKRVTQPVAAVLSKEQYISIFRLRIVNHAGDACRLCARSRRTVGATRKAAHPSLAAATYQRRKSGYRIASQPCCESHCAQLWSCCRHGRGRSHWRARCRTPKNRKRILHVYKPSFAFITCSCGVAAATGGAAPAGMPAAACAGRAESGARQHSRVCAYEPRIPGLWDELVQAPAKARGELEFPFPNLFPLNSESLDFGMKWYKHLQKFGAGGVYTLHPVVS